MTFTFNAAALPQPLKKHNLDSCLDRGDYLLNWVDHHKLCHDYREHYRGYCRTTKVFPDDTGPGETVIRRYINVPNTNLVYDTKDFKYLDENEFSKVLTALRIRNTYLVKEIREFMHTFKEIIYKTSDNKVPMACLRGVIHRGSKGLVQTIMLYKDAFNDNYNDPDAEYIELKGFEHLKSFILNPSTTYKYSSIDFERLKSNTGLCFAEVNKVFTGFGEPSGYSLDSRGSPQFNDKPKLPIGTPPRSKDDIIKARPFLALVARLCNFNGDLYDRHAIDNKSTYIGAKAAYWDLLGMIAYKIQNPDSGIQKAIFISGKPNIGKSTFYNVISNMLGHDLAKQTNIDVLLNPKGHVFEQPFMFMLINEVSEYLSDQYVEQIKQVISQCDEKIMIDPKYRDPYSVRDLSMKIFLSNNLPQALKNTTRRRLLIIECKMSESLSQSLSNEGGANYVFRNKYMNNKEWLKELLGIFQSKQFFSYDSFFGFNPYALPAETETKTDIFAALSTNANRIIDVLTKPINEYAVDVEPDHNVINNINSSIMLEYTSFVNTFNKMFKDRQAGKSLTKPLNEVNGYNGIMYLRLRTRNKNGNFIIKPLLNGVITDYTQYRNVLNKLSITNNQVDAKEYLTRLVNGYYKAIKLHSESEDQRLVNALLFNYYELINTDKQVSTPKEVLLEM